MSADRSPRARRARLSCALLALALAGGSAAGCSRGGGPSPVAPTVELVDESAASEALLRRRAREQAQPPEPLKSWSGSTLARERIPVEVARVLFPQIAKGAVLYDPDCYFRALPSQDALVQLPEIEGGSYRWHTNAEGWRDDREQLPESGCELIVVTGDSHVAGVCSNADSAPARLERALNARAGTPRCCVLNAAVGGFSAYSYLGMLDKWRARHPRAFAVVFYGGNDFYDLPRLSHYFARRAPAPADPQFRQRMLALAHSDPAAVARAVQGAQQAAYFARHPELFDEAVDTAVALVRELQDACAEQGIACVIAYLPAALDSQPERFAAEHAPILAALELSDEDAHLGDRLADAWLERLGPRAAELVDLRAPLRASGQACYWHHDLHLNLAGQQLLAEALEARLAACLAAR